LVVQRQTAVSYGASRLDQRLRHEGRVSVPVLQEVQGAPAGIPGPDLLLHPGPDVCARFWREFGERVKPHHEVWAVEGLVDVGRVRDWDGEPLPGRAGEHGDVALFFVDLSPAANWCHGCAYVLVWPDRDGRAIWIDHLSPPSDSLRLHRMVRHMAST
jgi:hypothetical protein